MVSKVKPFYEFLYFLLSCDKLGIGGMVYSSHTLIALVQCFASVVPIHIIHF